MIQALVCLALVTILAGHAVLAVIEATVRVVGMSAAALALAVPVVALIAYLIG